MYSLKSLSKTLHFASNSSRWWEPVKKNWLHIINQMDSNYHELALPLNQNNPISSIWRPNYKHMIFTSDCFKIRNLCIGHFILLIEDLIWRQNKTVCREDQWSSTSTINKGHFCGKLCHSCKFAIDWTSIYSKPICQP